jgi:hypothetical protein
MILIENENVIRLMNLEKVHAEKVGLLREVADESLHPHPHLHHLKETLPLIEENRLRKGDHRPIEVLEEMHHIPLTEEETSHHPKEDSNRLIEEPRHKEDNYPLTEEEVPHHPKGNNNRPIGEHRHKEDIFPLTEGEVLHHPEDSFPLTEEETPHHPKEDSNRLLEEGGLNEEYRPQLIEELLHLLPHLPLRVPQLEEVPLLPPHPPLPEVHRLKEILEELLLHEAVSHHKEDKRPLIDEEMHRRHAGILENKCLLTVEEVRLIEQRKLS